MALRGEWTTARERGRALVARPAHPPSLPVLAPVERVGDNADDLAHAEIRPHGARFELTLLLVTDLVALVALCSVARSLTLTAVTSAVAVATWRARGLYSHRISLSVLDDLPELGVGVLVGLAPGLAAALMVPTGLVGATAALQVATSVLGAVALGRFASYGVILRLRARGAVSYPTVLITSGGAADSLVDRIATHPESGLRIVGTIANHGGRTRGLPLLGPSADLSAIVREQHISNVVIGYGGISSGDLVDVLRRADWANLEIHVVPRLFELSTRRGTDDHIWGLPLVRLRAPARRVMARHTKRAFDLVGATLALVLTAPLMLAVALAVRFSLGRNIIFTQTRIGAHGRPFELMKFRSIDSGTAAGQGAWSVPADRIGRVGRFIRRYSLDELPQLINVLAGDMSLIGPRPERAEYVDRFVAMFPYYVHRHRMVVGMTGLAAVNGLRGNTSIEERCKFDNWYIDNWSLWLDTKILVRTVRAVVRGTGT